MTAFLMAEQLAQQSLSESQINNTLNDIQAKPISATRPAPNGKVTNAWRRNLTKYPFSSMQPLKQPG